jgi:hypothetical protein
MAERRGRRKEDGKEMSLEYARGYRDALEDVWEEVRKMSTKGYTSHELQIMVKSKEYASKKKIGEIVDNLEAQAQAAEVIDAEEPEISVVGVHSATPLVSVEVRPHIAYLIREQKPERCYQMFQKEVEMDRPGLVIARTTPFQIREKYEIGKSQIIWLTMSEKTDEALPPSALGMDMEGMAPYGVTDEYMSPSNLAGLFAYLVNFLDGNENAVIVVEGIEYLISHNEFSSVFKFIQTMKEKVEGRAANLFMSLNPSSLEPRQFSLIQSEMGEVL